MKVHDHSAMQSDDQQNVYEPIFSESGNEIPLLTQRRVIVKSDCSVICHSDAQVFSY